MNIIFNIEDRGNGWIFHWFSYMLSGFRFIGTNDSRSGPDGKGYFEQNTENVDISSLKLTYPIKLIVQNLPNPIASYQKETFEILKDKFILVSKDDIKTDDIVINNYGEWIQNKQYHLSPEAYTYIKDLFMNNITFNGNYKGKKYYLSRSRSHLLEGNKNDGGAKRRQIFNEHDLIEMLKYFGIETIFLEDYNLAEKIKIFNESDTIISPNSGGLTFTIFSSPNTKIVEINTAHPGQISRQYLDQCTYFNVPYYKYICHNYDCFDNMFINLNDFFSFLKHNQII